MAGAVVASVVAPHTPRIGNEAATPPFARGLIDGLRELGSAVRALRPQLIVLLSSHWVTTFNWYVTAHALHEGVCVADEAPDLIPGSPYRVPGHPAFAKALAARLKALDVPCGLAESPHFSWDYGSWVPLHYMDPAAQVPVVLLPSVICAELEECRRVGQSLHAVAQELELRVVFVASCALSHKVLRGPERWPSEALQALDRRFLELVRQGRVQELIDFVPAFCRDAAAEMGGRPLSGMIGALQAMAEAGTPLHGRCFGAYAQSSGSGNAALGFLAAS